MTDSILVVVRTLTMPVRQEGGRGRVRRVRNFNSLIVRKFATQYMWISIK